MIFRIHNYVLLYPLILALKKINKSTKPINPITESANGSPPFENCLMTTTRDSIMRIYKIINDLFITNNLMI